MKRTHALIAVFALMSMTAAAQVVHAQEVEPGVSLEGIVGSQLVSPDPTGAGRFSALTPVAQDKAHSRQTRCMSLGKC